MSLVVQKFDKLLETGINDFNMGTFVSEKEELKNMKEMCELLKEFDVSTEVLDRIGHILEFPIPEVIDLSFYLLEKFQNNPYLQIQVVTMIRVIVCDTDQYVPPEKYYQYNKTIIESLTIVEACIVPDDENEQVMLSRYVEDCIVILYKFQLNHELYDKQDFDIIKNMYTRYNEEISEVKMIYQSLMK